MFEKLLVDMMDLSVDNKLESSYNIPDLLNNNGWNASQVAGIWSPTMSSQCVPIMHWNTESLESLGGRGVMARVWNSLASREFRGTGKRHADSVSDPLPGSSKRMKRDREDIGPDPGNDTFASSNAFEPRIMSGKRAVT